MNIFKLLIPKEKAKEVQELQSWSVEWEVKTGYSGDTNRNAKVFIKLEDAQEFQKQIKESAAFLKCWVYVTLTQN